MMTFLIAWIATAAAFLIIDAIWLGWVATSFYQRELGHLMLERPNLGIAALFYLLYAAAIVLLAAMPAFRSGSWTEALFLGAVLGLAAYGTYDITNLATLKDWPLTMSIVDMIWGTTVTAVAALTGYFVLTHVSS